MGTIFKFVLILVVVYLIMAIIGASKVVKKQQAEMFAKYQEKQERFRHMTSEIFDETADAELKDGILTHIFCKEDEDFENLKSNLTTGERVVYTIYQMEIAADEGRGSVYNFFTSPSKEYLPYLCESFKAVGSEKIADLMEKIVSLAIQEQSGQYVETDLSEDAPTFQSYTFDFLDFIEQEQLNSKIVAYIREQKEDFLN